MRAKAEITREAGYSLLEMIVVLTILALVGATLTLTLRQSDRYANPRDVARQIAREAQATALKAVSSGRKSVLNVDLAKHIVTIDGGSAKVSIPQSLFLAMTAAERLVETGRIGSIEFFPDGSSTGGEVTVAAVQSDRYLVRVFWLTGEITTRQLP